MSVVAAIVAMSRPYSVTCSCGHPMRSATKAGLLLLADSHASLGLAHRVTLN